ncbi:hypothetical protein [Melioribacter sp. OK-6-Me]|uniref:hypothetical protein n=1 Tax=unclassified Melioribacter TaxID=2627329 RepID=UPI003EDABF5A
MSNKIVLPLITFFLMITFQTSAHDLPIVSRFVFGDYYYRVKRNNSHNDDINGFQFRRIFFNTSIKIAEKFYQINLVSNRGIMYWFNVIINPMSELKDSKFISYFAFIQSTSDKYVLITTYFNYIKSGLIDDQSKYGYSSITTVVDNILEKFHKRTTI